MPICGSCNGRPPRRGCSACGGSGSVSDQDVTTRAAIVAIIDGLDRTGHLPAVMALIPEADREQINRAYGDHLEHAFETERRRLSGRRRRRT